MAVTVKTRLNLKDMPKNISKKFSKDLKAEIKQVIISEIQSGNSPVRNKRFRPYSSSYAKRFKGNRRSPVNMTLTGRMLKSLNVRQNRIGQVLIVFNSEIAVYHDKLGAGTTKVIRRLLPSRRGEQFDPVTTKLVDKILLRAVRKSVRQSNR